MTELIDSMPQTVPSVGFSTSAFDYSVAFVADNFDLSLLPSSSDSEVPYSPQDHQQLLSFYDTTSPPPMFPSPTPEDIYKPIQKDDYLLQTIKEEPFSSLIFGQSWDSSSCGSAYSSPVYCPSPQDSVSPNIKQETTIDLEEIVREARYLQEITYPERKKDLIIRTILERDDKPEEKKADYRLLREVLKDTSFQKKYNLKPFNIDGLGTGFKTEIKMEVTDSPEPGKSQDDDVGCVVEAVRKNIGPMLSLAIEQMKEDVHNTSTVLGISRDPTQWSTDDVRSWLVWNLQQYNLPMSLLEYFNMSGVELAKLEETDFNARVPQYGSVLHAQLEIWKEAWSIQGTNVDVSGLLQDTTTQSSSSCGDASDDEEDDEMADSPQTSQSSPQSKASGRGGSHIHLWQFLKELLATPQVNGACIRWLDRSKGVFKIEDSVRVARLWGKRKNRPAMNYDKLSRSIRQYYKKGIMKKTERSQRLVYQFCHPYCL